MLKYITLFTVLLFVLNGCQSAKEVDYSFFVAGHTYGSLNEKKPGLHPPFVAEFEKLNRHETLKFGVLTGDLIHFPDKAPYWEKAFEDIGRLNCEVHIVPGNHEVADRTFFRKYIDRNYYAFTENQDLFVVLDGNEDGWNIEGEQLAFLENTLEKQADSVHRIFLFVHQLIWWKEATVFAGCQPNSLMSKSDTLHFHDKILPLLQRSLKPVYLFAGDVGAYEERCSVFHHKLKNVTLLASGMGNYETDNYLLVDILKNGDVKINLVALNCDRGFGCMGDIEDY